MTSTINPLEPRDGDKSNPAPEIRANFAAAKADIEALQAGEGFALPDSDPGVAGALWSDSGTVKVSAG